MPCARRRPRRAGDPRDAWEARPRGWRRPPGGRPGRCAGARWQRSAGTPPARRDRPPPCRCPARGCSSRRHTAAARTPTLPRPRCAARGSCSRDAAAPLRGSRRDRTRPAFRRRLARGRPPGGGAAATALRACHRRSRRLRRRSSSASSFKRLHSRSASRREFAKTMVLLALRTSSRTRRSILGQIDVRASAPLRTHRPPARPDPPASAH